MTRKQSMRTKHTTKSRSTSKRHRSLRKRSGGVGIFDSEPSNATDDALPLHKKVLNFFTNIFSSAPPVPQNASPRPGQPAQQLQQVQRPVQQQTPESTNFGSDDIAQFTPPDATATAISQSPPVPPPDAAPLPPPDAAPQFGSPTTAFGGRRRRSNKNKNKNKKK